MEFLSGTAFLVAMTTLAFIFAKKLYQKFEIFLLNPVFLTIAICILFLKVTGITYEEYAGKTGIINFWLEPSVIALGVPLYQQMGRIKKDWRRIILAVLTGSISGIVSVVVLAKAFGATREVYLSLAPKSVTTPIAMGISETLGGIPPLTAAIVVTVGIFGAVIGESFMKLLRVHNPKSVGLAIGAASHALGTAKIAPKGEEYGSYAALGLAINGILTAILSTTLIPLLEKML